MNKHLADLMPPESQTMAHLDSCILYCQSDFLSKVTFFKSNIPHNLNWVHYVCCIQKAEQF